MNKKLKARWIKVLLSGEYRQGFKCLKNHGRYCCLGVLADIQGLLGKNIDKNNFACSGENLEGKFFSEKVESQLIELNDGEKRTFKEIANWIKKNL